MLCTLLEPSEGTAEIAGYDIRKDAAEVRKRIGVVSDGVSLYKDLTIEENLKLFSTLYDLPSSFAEDRMNNLLDMFNFKEKSKRLVGELSSGWMKKAMIIAALIHEKQNGKHHLTGSEQFHISLRSDGTVDVSAIAASFGGGGHATAAGFDVQSGLGKIKSDIANLTEKN